MSSIGGRSRGQRDLSCIDTSRVGDTKTDGSESSQIFRPHSRWFAHWPTADFWGVSPARDPGALGEKHVRSSRC